MQTDGFSGRVAVISGASLGIGRAAAVSLAAAGCRVVVNYRSHAADAETVVNQIRQAGGTAIPYCADMGDQEQVEAMIDAAVREFGRLDIAVSNAAYSDRDSFVTADMTGFRRTLDVTMWGAFYLTRSAARRMIQQGDGGAIVIVSSPHAYIPVPRSMAYNMSKAAIEQMAKTAAIELAEHRIRINIIQPGWTDTPGERKFFSEDALAKAGAKIPLGRLGRPDEVAECIRFVCDPRQAYMTGSTLLIDGGITLPWWSHGGSAAPGD